MIETQTVEPFDVYMTGYARCVNHVVYLIEKCEAQGVPVTSELIQRYMEHVIANAKIEHALGGFE
jgi:hypothetical protein